MSTKQAVLTEKAPAPLPGIYSQAIVANGVVYCSGAVGMDPVTRNLAEGDVKARTVRYFLACVSISATFPIQSFSLVSSFLSHATIKQPTTPSIFVPHYPHLRPGEKKEKFEIKLRRQLG